MNNNVVKNGDIKQYHQSKLSNYFSISETLLNEVPSSKLKTSFEEAVNPSYVETALILGWFGMACGGAGVVASLAPILVAIPLALVGIGLCSWADMAKIENKKIIRNLTEHIGSPKISTI